MAVVQEEDQLVAAEAGTATDKHEIRNALSLSPSPEKDIQGLVCSHSMHGWAQWIFFCCHGDQWVCHCVG